MSYNASSFNVSRVSMNRLLPNGAVLVMMLAVGGIARVHAGDGHGHFHIHGHFHGHRHHHGHFFGHHHHFHPFLSFGWGCAYPSYPYVIYDPYDYYYPRHVYALPRAYAPASYDAAFAAETRSGSGRWVPPPPKARTAAKTARIEVRLPNPDAEVLFDGKKTSAVGRVRQFETGELEPGESYTAKVTARFTRDGREMTDAREVDLRAGASAVVDFTQPAPAERVASPRRNGAHAPQR